MVDYVWTNNSSGNTNWNDQLNWNDGISGYPDGTDDTATFNSTWTSNCTVNEVNEIGSLTVTPDYTGSFTLSANLSTVIASINGASGAEVSFASSSTSTMRQISIGTGNKDIQHLTATNCYIIIQQGGTQNIRHLTIAYSNDAGTANAALELQAVTSGTFKDIHIYQATYGIAFTTGACSLTITNLYIEECAKGDPTNYASGGSLYFSNHAHAVVINGCRMDCEHIIFAGATADLRIRQEYGHIACVGDSIVQGSTLHGRFWNKFADNDPMDNQWPRRLTGKLTNLFCMNMGEGADYSINVYNRIGGIIKQRPHMTIIAVGVNDAYYITQGTWTQAQAKEQLTNIFTALSNAGLPNVFICAITPTEIAARNTQLELLNTWLATEVPTYGFTFIEETWSDFIEGGADHTLKNAYAADSVHLNATGYEAYATLLATKLPTYG